MNFPFFRSRWNGTPDKCQKAVILPIYFKHLLTCFAKLFKVKIPIFVNISLYYQISILAIFTYFTLLL
jgi:hypothetical protein